MTKAIIFGSYNGSSWGGVDDNILKNEDVASVNILILIYSCRNRRYPMKYLISDVCGICLSDTGMK